MPPEQRAAIGSLQEGRPIEVTVDGRADVYALAAMLYEALGGRLMIATGLPPLAGLNPTVSVGLSDVVARCLSRRPEDRYPDALALADDLRRHLTDQPLVGVPDRDVAERWRKWRRRRRRPGALRTAATFALVAGAVVVLLAGAGSRVRDRRDRAELALLDGGRHLSARHYAEAARTLQRGLALAEGVPFYREPRQRTRDQLATARRLLLADQLHRVAEEVRVLYGADAVPTERLRSLGAQCDALWQQRDVVAALLGAPRDRDVAADL